MFAGKNEKEVGVTGELTTIIIVVRPSFLMCRLK